MRDNLDFSGYLSDVLNDWRDSRNAFPKNVYPVLHWPIPFFGNPARAIAATVGVNPSSGEFLPDRNWNTVQRPADWKKWLKNYFIQSTRPHDWFMPWRAGLALLHLDYGDGSAAHFDVSYRPTTAMLRNKATDPGEFRRMVEQDVRWFFRLLLKCPDLRLLLVFGPIVRANGSTESLAQFLRNNAPLNGFNVSSDGQRWSLKHPGSNEPIYVHEVSARGKKCITCRVVEDLLIHRHELLRRLGKRSNEDLCK